MLFVVYLCVYGGPYLFSTQCFIIPAGFSCNRADGTCWFRSYTGLLCPHGLNVAVDRMSRANSAEEQNEICRLATAACNKNWHRETYIHANELEGNATDLRHKPFDAPATRMHVNKPKSHREKKKASRTRRAVQDCR